MTTLVVTDLDGSVWPGDLGCRPEVLAAIAEVQARPDTVLLAATGRRRDSARYGLDLNGLVMPAVLLNGAMGYDYVADSVFHAATFANDDLRSVLQVLADHRVAPVAYLADNRAMVVEGVTTCLRHLDSLGTDAAWVDFATLADRDDVLGLSMLGIDETAVAAPLADLIELPGTEAVGFGDQSYPPYSVMIAPAGITKVVGIEAFCRTRALAPDRVIAIGDGGNDLAMLRAADVAVAVAGGDPRVLEVADFVIGPPEHGGWADVIDLL